MKRIILSALLLSVLVICFVGCKNNDVKQNDKPKEEQQSVTVVKPDFDKSELDEKFGTEEIYIVKTYMETPSEIYAENLENGILNTVVTHYQLSDGSWKTDDYSYKYKLILKGRMNNAEHDSEFQILSNSDDITFDDAWKAFGFSSNSEDYFAPQDAIIVAVK